MATDRLRGFSQRPEETVMAETWMEAVEITRKHKEALEWEGKDVI